MIFIRPRIQLPRRTSILTVQNSQSPAFTAAGFTAPRLSVAIYAAMLSKMYPGGRGKSMDAREEITLWGGPVDGKSISLPNRPHEYRIPIAPDMWSWLGHQDFTTKPNLEIKTGIYAPRINQRGVIQRSSLGELIYEWRGIRNA